MTKKVINEKAMWKWEKIQKLLWQKPVISMVTENNQYVKYDKKQSFDSELTAIGKNMDVKIAKV